jgi:uncharacterized membrane protein YgcG
MRRLLRCIAVLAVLAAAPALAQERVTNFVSDVRVETSGTLDVIETISVVSEGDEIKRGIQRDFPTQYRNGIGRIVTVGFDVVDVARDGHSEPYQLIRMSNGQRVRIGDADALLPPGNHVFRLHYRTTRQIGFFRDFDELYWNATGTGWTFPIQRAEARITLPSAVPFGKRAVYTGAQGATNQDAEVVSERPGQIVFRTTKGLEAGEGLTIAAAWRKGIVAAPNGVTQLGWALWEYGPLVLAIAGVLGILGYLARAVWRVQHNPDPRPIVPLFAPPDDLSAAALRLIWRQGSDDRLFSAAIVDTAVRGGLRIVEMTAGREEPTRRLEKTDVPADLPAAEKKMLGPLFKGVTKVPLNSRHYSRLIDAREALEEELERSYGDGVYFSEAAKRTFLGWKLFGGLWLLVALALVLTDGFTSLPTTLGTVAGIVGGAVGLRLLSRGRKTIPTTSRGLRISSWIVTVLVWLATAFLCGKLLVMGVTSGNPLPMAVPLIALPFVIFASSRLRGPTATGWPMRDRILGFRHYLSVAEEDRLDALNPPEKTVALFERYLPYAIALDVENRWAERFIGLLAAAATDATVTQGNDWYRGDADRWTNPTAFVSAIGPALSETIASASTEPSSSSSSSSDSSDSSSSSGSSGGGSSGGGGGGGGGSGW